MSTKLLKKTAADVLDTIKGVEADPNRIGNEYMPAEIEPDTLILPDFEGAIPPANALGLSGGRLALGDGSTTGGNLLTPRRVAGSVVCDMNGTNKVSSRFAIVGIPLTAAEVVADASVKITGTVKLIFDGSAFYATEDPVVSLTIGFAHDAYKADATTKWLKYNCLPTGTEVVFLVTNHFAGDFYLPLNPGAGANKVVLNIAQPAVVSDRWGGAAGATFTINDSANTFLNPTDPTVAVDEDTADIIWLCVEIVMGASGTNPDINFNVVYDLDTEVTIP